MTAQEGNGGSPEMTPKSSKLAPLRQFIATENSSAIILLGATIAALIWSNSPWSTSYTNLWTTELSLRVGDAELTLDFRHWVNDGLMALFFFVVGLEIRREFDMGEMRERRRIATPVLAAIGGMVAPVLIYLAITLPDPAARGWGIVMGTDTAIALGILALVGRTTSRARTFLLTVVIVDDVVALTVIALAYTDDLSVLALLTAVVLFVVILVMRASGVRHGVPYFIVATGMWLATLASGVHATIAGVAVGILVAAYPPRRDALEHAGAVWRLFREEPTPEYARTASRSLSLAVSGNERLQNLFHPWTSYVIVPIFALANAGIEVTSELIQRAITSRITIGIVAGLVVGKIVGIVGAARIARLPRFGRLPLTVPTAHLVGLATVSGIGFTVSLLIADITFTGSELEEAKLGIFIASVLASILTWLVYLVMGRLQATRPAGERGTAPPIVDLSGEVDPEVDHLRGPVDALVTLVEYGDFECPYCGRLEPVLRELANAFGNSLTFVFRHLPLDDVHPRARFAAEASEVAGEQGLFWEMHDLLMIHQTDLSESDVLGYAEELGLDRERFIRAIRDRRYAARLDRDVASADESGAAGTPTFFLNGRRYRGIHGLDSLTKAVENELRQAVRFENS